MFEEAPNCKVKLVTYKTLGNNVEFKKYLHGEVKSSRREEWVPHKGDPVSALPTTPGASSNGSSPRCLLDFRGILCGSGVAI